MSMIRMVVGTCAVGVIALGAGATYSQDYPTKPVRIVTGVAGGGSDFVARPIAQAISGPLGQPVIIDNRGSSLLSQDVVAKSPGDGYTLLLTGQSLWITPLLQSVPFDAVRDFVPIVVTTSAPNVLAIHPSLPVKSVKDLIALAKKHPGELNYGAAGRGTATTLTAELFKSMAGVNLVYVPYKATSQAVTGMVVGEVQVMFPAATLVTPHVATGRLKILAVTSAQPMPILPGLPTVAASGLPGFVVESVDGILAPAKTPAVAINRLNREIVRYLNTAEAKKRFMDTGSVTVGGTPEEFAAQIKSEIAMWGKVIKEAGIKGD